MSARSREPVYVSMTYKVMAPLKKKETATEDKDRTEVPMGSRGAVAPLTAPCIELAALKIAVSREAKAIKNLLEEVDSSRKFAKRARREGSVAAADLIEDRARGLEVAVASRQTRLHRMLSEVGTRSFSELAAFRPTCACCGHPDLAEAYRIGNQWVGKECYHHYPLQRCHSPKVTGESGIDRSHAGPVEIELQEDKT